MVEALQSQNSPLLLQVHFEQDPVDELETLGVMQMENLGLICWFEKIPYAASIAIVLIALESLNPWILVLSWVDFFFHYSS